MWQEADAKVFLAVILMAIVLAAALAVGYYYILGRPTLPEGSYVVEVEDRSVLVEANPEMQVQILGDNPPTGGEPGQGGQELLPETGQEPATPIPEVVVPTPVPTEVIVPTPVPPTPVPVQQYIFQPYQVGAGDTLYSISNRFVTTIPLMARFGISATKIVPGTTIQVPVANPAFCPGTFPYVVEEGDTLSRIARKCDTTVERLKEINGFGETFRLDMTSVICVPNPGPTPRQ